VQQHRLSVKDDATRQRRLRSEAQQSCEPRTTLARAALGPAFLKHIVQILALKQIKCCASLEISQKVLMAAAEPATSIRTLRLKVKREAYAWLKSAAIEVNAVWNFANETSYKAARPFAGPSRFLSAFDLDKLSAGACECFERIGSGTIQAIEASMAKELRVAPIQRAGCRSKRSSLGGRVSA
jgi:molybdopterin-binding protein